MNVLFESLHRAIVGPDAVVPKGNVPVGQGRKNLEMTKAQTLKALLERVDADHFATASARLGRSYGNNRYNCLSSEMRFRQTPHRTFGGSMIFDSDNAVGVEREGPHGKR